METPFWVYVITSIEKSYTYVGLTDNLERRLGEHNKGYNRTTKPYAPFRLVYEEICASREAARVPSPVRKFQKC